MVKASNEGSWVVVMARFVKLKGSAKWPEGLERSGCRWEYIFCASARAFCRRRVCLCFVEGAGLVG